MSVIGSRLPIYATCTPQEASKYAENTKKGLWALLPSELAWTKRQVFLESKGYLLRPRYRPKWMPSWLGTNRKPDFCEDSIHSRKDDILDATGTEDGLLVAIKLVRRDRDEIEIAQFLSSNEFLQNPMNHSVPILNVLPDPLEPSGALLVMPYLRPFNDPEFTAIGEVVDFMRQTLEGLSFMHSHGVAHRDCASANIMMDGSPLYPQGHHPSRLNYTPDGIFDAPYLARIDHPVKYFYIDFGISSRVQEGEPPYVLGTKGRDKEPPELSDKVPYNPFMLDIFILGHLYQMEFLDKYTGLEFLSPLVQAMTEVQPALRPTAEAALMMFRSIKSSLNNTFLRWRLRSRTESAPERVVYDTVAVAREGIYHLKRLVG